MTTRINAYRGPEVCGGGYSACIVANAVTVCLKYDVHKRHILTQRLRGYLSSHASRSRAESNKGGAMLLATAGNQECALVLMWVPYAA